MKLLYAFFIFLAPTALSIGIGNYVSYPGSGIAEFGTVIGRSDHGYLIRPHRTQGDFTALVEDLSVVKAAEDIEALRPAKAQFSTNLMWVKKKPDDGIFIFHTDDMPQHLARLASWAQATKNEVVLWYDSLMVHKNAAVSTKNVFERLYPRLAKLVVFKDLRTVISKQDFDIFGEDTPVYLRVDLYRVITASRTLEEHRQKGQKYYFIYADMDMPALDEDAIFDAPTMMDLEDYGIVMAHCDGKDGNKPFENGFQIIANTKLNLLHALRIAIIEANIMRIRRAKSHGVDLSSLNSMIFDSYRPMFAFYYQLEGWGRLITKSINNIESRLPEVFGLESVNPLLIRIIDPQLLFKMEYFDYQGKKALFEGLYYPKKIVDIPPSQFGGAPTVFNHQELTPKNYLESLLVELKKPQIDPKFLAIAEQNRYWHARRLIKEKMDHEPEEQK